MTSAVETVSPLDFTEVDRICRISRTLVAECEVCGRVMRGGVHLCDIARAGFLCVDHCPFHSGRVELTIDELMAIKANRKRCRAER